MPRLTPSDIKTALLAHFRFHKMWIFFTTEVSEWRADILMIDPGGSLVEFGAKASLADLSADLTQKKHEWYKNYDGKSGMVPNRLYFAVPEELGKEAKKILAPWPRYGLAAVNEKDKTVRVLKIAGWIHKLHNATEKARKLITLRMGSELIDLRRSKDMDKTGGKFSPHEKDILDLGPFVFED